MTATAGRIPEFTISIDGIEYNAETAVVERWTIGYEDHGIFSTDIGFTNTSWGQGLPGYTLDKYNQTTKEREGTAFGCQFLIECVKRLGSPGKTGQQVLVLRRDGAFGTIEGFAALNPDGSYGEPFIPKTLAKKYEESR